MKQDPFHYLSQTPLIKGSIEAALHSPPSLCAVSRAVIRQSIGIPTPLPFEGVDVWNAFELSWLDPLGKPIVARAVFHIPCQSPCLIESKSLKLYLHAISNTCFDSCEQVKTRLQQDLSSAVGLRMRVQLYLIEADTPQTLTHFDGIYLDTRPIACAMYQRDTSLLRVHAKPRVKETLYSNLLKTNCPVTQQPDWGSIQICYRGLPIDRDGLLRYIVSYRHHHGFHEQCVEQIFQDIMTRCQPDQLLVHARYTRRGGLDINPIRSTHPLDTADWNQRLIRQ